MVLTNLSFRPIVRVAANCVFKLYDSNWPVWNQLIQNVKDLENIEHAHQLAIYSNSDPMCNTEAMIDLLEIWKTDNRSFNARKWEKSPHAAHLV